MKIKHSVPSHDCFMIIQPARGDYRSRCLLVNGEKGEVYELEDVDSGNITRAILLDLFCYAVNELPESICYLCYGLPRLTVIKALYSRYPELQSGKNVEVLIIQKQ